VMASPASSVFFAREPASAVRGASTQFERRSRATFSASSRADSFLAGPRRKASSLARKMVIIVRRVSQIICAILRRAALSSFPAAAARLRLQRSWRRVGYSELVSRVTARAPSWL
jgi:hypothetical protein